MKNKFRKRNVLYPRIVKRKIASLMNLSTTSSVSTLNQYLLLKLLKPLFSHSQAISTEYSSNTPRLWISQSAPKCSRTMTIIEIWMLINSLDEWKTGRISKEWSRELSVSSSMKKLKKLQIRNADLGSSWIEWKGGIFYPLRPFNLIASSVLNWMAYGKPFTNCSTLPKIVKPISVYWKKSQAK